MKDKWINIGYEGEELKPYTEPEEDFGDTKRIGEGRESRAVGHRPGSGNFPAPTSLVSASEKFARHLGRAEKSGLWSLPCYFVAV